MKLEVEEAREKPFVEEACEPKDVGNEVKPFAKRDVPPLTERACDEVDIAPKMLSMVSASVGVPPIPTLPDDARPAYCVKDWFRKMETVLELTFATARSALPSPLRSAVETLRGLVPVV